MHRHGAQWMLAAAALTAALLAGCARRPHGPKFELPATKEQYASPTAQRVRAGAAGANLIVIVLDAARADRFGAYGYQWQTTPNSDGLLAESVVFDEAYCTAPNTKASIASLFTAQSPDTHGTLSVRWMMTAEGVTLAESLRRAGYRTASFIANPVLGACFGFDRGFDHFDEVFRQADLDPLRPLDWDNVDARLVVKSAIAWLKAHRKERLFAYVHFLEPHAPYDSPERLRRRVMGPGRGERPDSDSVRYDGRLAYVDEAVGQLLSQLDALGLREKSVVVLMADHGEALGEHGTVGHGKTAYTEMAHVPLAVRLPRACGAAPGHRSEIVSLTDVMPTLADLLQFEAPSTMQGRSRLRLLAGEQEPGPAFAVTRARGEDETGGAEHIDEVCYALRVPRYTLVIGDRGRRVELYDREADATETHNVARQQRPVVKRLRRQFVAWADTQRARPVVLRGGKLPTPPESAPPNADEKTLKRLKALGYLK